MKNKISISNKVSVPVKVADIEIRKIEGEGEEGVWSENKTNGKFDVSHKSPWNVEETLIKLVTNSSKSGEDAEIFTSEL